MPYVTQYVLTRTKPSPLKRLVSWASIAIMLTATLLIALPFWPGFTYNLHAAWPNHQLALAQAKAASEPPGEGNWLLIPAINIKTPIIEGSDIGILDKETGVWHQTGTPTNSNFVIAGHRFKYLPPNQTTFYNLDKLKTNDKIIVWWQGQQFQYSITKQFTVGRNATEILNPTPQRQVTLYTCTDLNASRRLVAIGMLDPD